MLTPPFTRTGNAPLFSDDGLSDEDAAPLICAAICSLSETARQRALATLGRAEIRPPVDWTSPAVTEPLFAASGV